MPSAIKPTNRIKPTMTNISATRLTVRHDATTIKTMLTTIKVLTALKTLIALKMLTALKMAIALKAAIARRATVRPTMVIMVSRAMTA